MQVNNLDKARQIYLQFIEKIQFHEIEHVPNEFFHKLIGIQDSCLCISHQFFNLYYITLMTQLCKAQENDLNKYNWIAQVLLVMNGENQKAWNLKKKLLLKNKLDIKRELKFNAAVCYKNKKSSIYYEYRIRLYEQFLQLQHQKQSLLQIYQSQSKLINKVLARFFRNYYCWMYRNRLFKLFSDLLGDQLIDLQINLLHKFIQLNPNDYSAYSRLIAVLKKKNQPKIDEQVKWIKELEDFCIAAYQKKESFQNIQTYKTFLGIT